MNILSNFIVTALAITLAGCAGGIRTFPNTLPKNMHVTTDVDGGKVEAAVAFDIHRMKKNCETEHEGRINLENGSIGVGLPSDEPLYLDFIFVSRAGFGSPVGATRHGTLLTLKGGYEYQAHVHYKKGIYAVEIKEMRKGAGVARVLQPVPLKTCKRG